MTEVMRLTRALWSDTMLHSSWFLPQLYHITSVGGKNRGEAKAVKKAQGAPCLLAKRSRQTGWSQAALAARPCNLGSRGAPGRTTLQPYRGARSSALYRPDNRTIKCPARHVGPGILTGGETQSACSCMIREAGCGSSMAGWYVKLTMTTVLTAERRC